MRRILAANVANKYKLLVSFSCCCTTDFTVFKTVVFPLGKENCSDSVAVVSDGERQASVRIGTVSQVQGECPYVSVVHPVVEKCAYIILKLPAFSKEKVFSLPYKL